MDTRHKFIVSDKCKFVYFEIQKCATETMRQYFLGTTRANRTRNEYGAVRISGGPHKADSYIERGYYQFAFVRNPWARTVSAWLSKFVYYHDPKHPTLPGIRDPQLSLQTTFEEYVGFISRTSDRYADCHFKSMHRFIRDRRMLVGKVEHLKKDFDMVRMAIGIPLYDIPRVNETPKDKPWREYYTPELRDMVAKRYAEDIKRFGYKFD